jgi:hypothetical protein
MQQMPLLMRELALLAKDGMLTRAQVNKHGNTLQSAVASFVSMTASMNTTPEQALLDLVQLSPDDALEPEKVLQALGYPATLKNADRAAMMHNAVLTEITQRDHTRAVLGIPVQTLD